MKKIFFAIVVSMVCLCSMAVNAQDDVYKQELKTSIVASGASISYEAIIGQMLAMQPSLTDEAKTTITEKALAELIDLMTPVYQKHISLDDLRAINAFYQTEAGKRIGAAVVGITADSMPVGQQWAMKLQGLIQSAVMNSIEQQK